MSNTALKLLALALMFIDHIAEFIPGTPIWFHWLGRLSAPIFLFSMAWGFKYTHDRKKYVLRMYLFGVLMSVMNFVLNNLYSGRAYMYIINNIFVTLFLVAVIVWIIEIQRENPKKGSKLAACFILWQVISTLLCLGASSLISSMNTPIIGAVTANILTAEGGVPFVILGVLIYFAKENPRKLSWVYVIYTGLMFLLRIGPSVTLDWIFNVNYQWMMVFSLPFMLMYNGKKGRGLKYLFYIFYPVHIALLFLLGNCML
ncbi:MAG: TraX family protein [Oscillospiraceae bacterium]